jgi:hypothetical protein
MSWTVLAEAAEAIRTAAAARDPRAAGLPVAAIGWATVEHERAIRELDALLGAPRDAGPGAAPDAAAGPGAWAPIGRDPALGAQAWLRDPGGAAGDPSLVVLEPDTEGRLAASLARFGEGVAVAYLGAGRPPGGTLVRGGPAWGPHAVVLGEPADDPGFFDPGER